MIETVKRICGLPYQFGGEQHSGWLPSGAATPLPTPIQNVLLDIEIQFDGSGYLLCYTAQDGTVSGDNWYQSLSDAEQAAEEEFGVQPAQWYSVR